MYLLWGSFLSFATECMVESSGEWYENHTWEHNIIQPHKRYGLILRGCRGVWRCVWRRRGCHYSILPCIQQPQCQVLKLLFHWTEDLSQTKEKQQFDDKAVVAGFKYWGAIMQTRCSELISCISSPHVAYILPYYAKLRVFLEETVCAVVHVVSMMFLQAVEQSEKYWEQSSLEWTRIQLSCL